MTRTNKVIFSIYDLDDTPFTEIINSVACKGTVIFRQEGDDFFGNGNSYVSQPVKDPSWLTVLNLANDMVDVTGDSHHIFLEGISQNSEIPGEYTFIMGS